MRVAVLTQRFPSSHEQWAGHSGYQTVRRLASRCDLQVFYPEAVYPALLSPARRRRLDPHWSPADVRVSYHRYSAVPVASRALNGRTIARTLLPHVRRFRPDVLLSYFVYPDGYASIRIGKELNVPVVLTATGSDLNSIPGPLTKMLTRSALRKADFVTTVSQDLCETARRLGADPARSRSKLNGCDASVFHPRDRAEARRALGVGADAEAIVYVGRLDVRKGLIELIDATAELRTRRPRLRCFLVGDGRDGPQVMQAIARHKAEGYITIVPPCPTDDVAGWMAASDLVTLPSYNEGCPNVVLEALSAGRPVVATNVGGIPELMDDSCGRLVPARDVPALTRALDRVLGQPWCAKEIAHKNGRSWSDVADESYRMLEDTIQSRRYNSPRTSAMRPTTAVQV